MSPANAGFNQITLGVNGNEMSRILRKETEDGDTPIENDIAFAKEKNVKDSSLLEKSEICTFENENSKFTIGRGDGVED